MTKQCKVLNNTNELKQMVNNGYSNVSNTSYHNGYCLFIAFDENDNAAVLRCKDEKESNDMIDYLMENKIPGDFIPEFDGWRHEL